MPRRPRSFLPGELYHVVNRGNDKRVIFPRDDDYERFVQLLIAGRARAAVDIVGFSLMSTHFHLLLRPGDRTAIPRYMHFVDGRFARELRASTDTLGHGHVFKKPYFGKGAEDELGRLTVMAYVERNALAAGVVSRAEEWQWCSLSDRTRPRDGLVTPDCLQLPPNWIDILNLSWDDCRVALDEYVCQQRWRLPWK
jgi:putative transposase